MNFMNILVMMMPDYATSFGQQMMFGPFLQKDLAEAEA